MRISLFSCVFLLSGNVTCIASTGEIPIEFSLEQKYRTPFNLVTKTKFDKPQLVQKVRLAVYDMFGIQVATIVDWQLQAGRNEIEFDSSGLSRRIYFYKLDTGTFTGFKKMILVK